MCDTDNEIKVSILCAVYNHEKYLRECLDGFVKQKTSFKFEVIINDDCSTDNSKAIIEEYQKKYSNIIVPIYQKENQYSQGKRITLDILLPKARGKYFAFCEGDDYWNDENKLQKQYDFMEKNKEYTLCVNNAITVDIHNNIKKYIKTTEEDRDLAFNEIILGGGGFIATNSIFAPIYLTKNLPDFFYYFTNDYIWQMYLSSKGKTFCFKDNMSTYRTGVEGSWTQRMKKDREQLIQTFKKIIFALEELDKYTKKKYHDSFEEMIIVYNIKIYELKGEYKRIIKRPYITVALKRYPKSVSIKYFIKAYFNWIYILYTKIKKR